MSTTKDAPTASTPEELARQHSDDVELKMAKPRVEQVDYAGAAKVTDPAELRLVRKLDMRIMVSNSAVNSLLC
jgi:hypothetical protein